MTSLFNYANPRVIYWGAGSRAELKSELARLNADRVALVTTRSLLANQRLFQEMRDKPGLAAVLSHLGNVAMAEGDFGQAGLLYSKCYDVFQELGTSHWRAVTLLSLADCARLGGDHPLARTRLEASLAIFQSIGYRPGIGILTEELRNLAREQRGHK